MTTPTPSSPEDDPLDLSDWEPEDPVLAEIPEANSEFLESRRRIKQAEAAAIERKPIGDQAADAIGSGTMQSVGERASFQSDPDRFLKCLAILETALKLRQRQGVERGEPATTEDLIRLAMTTLKALPIDLETNADFLVQFVSRSVQISQAEELEQFQADLETAPAPEMTGIAIQEQARVQLPAETNEALDTVSKAWGKRPLDLELGTIKFDEGRAVLDDVQQIPGIGAALVNKEGKFRSRFYRTLWWTSLVVALAMLLLILIGFVQLVSNESEVAQEPTLVDEAHYKSPDLDRLEETLGKFVRATDWRTQLDYIRHPSTMELKMEQHFNTHPFRWGMDYQLLTADLQIIHDIPQVLCLIELVQSKERRALLVEVTDNGDYLVDWEYAELWQEVPWDEFRTRSTLAPADMLVAMRPGKYYNFSFQDSAIWQCWEVLDPAEQGISMFAYARRESEAGQKLQQLLEDRLLASRSPLMSTVLRLRHPKDGVDQRQVEILSVIEEGPLRRH